MHETLPTQSVSPGEQLTLPQLEAVLRFGGIPVDEWGTGEAKTLAHLLAEIEEGETQLTVSPEGEIRREIVAVGIEVYGIDAKGQPHCLKEDRQVFADGRVRRRELGESLAEKLKPGEDALSAVDRALQEEIGVTGAVVHWLDVEDEVRLSTSYPGLMTHFQWLSFCATIPAESFQSDGYVEYQPDKTNYYIWEPTQSSTITEIPGSN